MDLLLAIEENSSDLRDSLFRASRGRRRPGGFSIVFSRSKTTGRRREGLKFVRPTRRCVLTRSITGRCILFLFVLFFFALFPRIPLRPRVFTRSPCGPLVAAVRRWGRMLDIRTCEVQLLISIVLMTATRCNDRARPGPRGDSSLLCHTPLLSSGTAAKRIRSGHSQKCGLFPLKCLVHRAGPELIFSSDVAAATTADCPERR